MKHDSFLIVVVLSVLLAGCIGSDLPKTGDSETQPTGTQSSVRTSLSEPTTSPTNPRIEVPPCPNRPDSFTNNSVVEFAMQFEQARETQLALAETSKNLTELSVETQDANVTKTKNGWIVHFTARGPYMRWNTSDPEAPDHADPGFYTANYFITNETVRRTQATEVVDPRENGSTVECPPGG